VASRPGYEVVFASSAIEFFLTLTKRNQRKVLDRARELAGDPFLVPDFQSEDATRRVISHFMVDGFLFDFWLDHAVKQVIVTDIDFVE
jgi:hypothetical protein